MSAAPVDQITGEKTEPKPGAGESRIARMGRKLSPARTFLESKGGVYSIVFGLLLAIVILTILFGIGAIPSQFLALYEADAEMLIVAAAVLVVAYEIEFKHRGGG